MTPNDFAKAQPEMLRDYAEEKLRQAIAEGRTDTKARLEAMIADRASWRAGFTPEHNYFWVVPQTANGAHFHKQANADHIGYHIPWSEFQAYRKRREKEVDDA